MSKSEDVASGPSQFLTEVIVRGNALQLGCGKKEK